MSEQFNEDVAPLPRELLPAASAPADAVAWRFAHARILAAAEPTLGILSAQHVASEPWSDTLASWWKPAAALSAAAAALLIVLDTSLPVTSSDDVPLSVVAAGGDPSAVLAGLGIDSDPVLALIVVQEQAK